MAFSRVDLPQPEGPSRQTNWPSGMCRLMFLQGDHFALAGVEHLADVGDVDVGIV